VEKYGRAGQAADNILIRHIHFACWIAKVTDTHSECAVLLAFPLQQWLQERASVLRYKLTACLVLEYLLL